MLSNYSADEQNGPESVAVAALVGVHPGLEDSVMDSSSVGYRAADLVLKLEFSHLSSNRFLN